MWNQCRLYLSNTSTEIVVMADTQYPSGTPAFDRGPTKYFHGREQILNVFEKRITGYVRKKTGTTFLIQGAPGVGKTALLAECKKRAIAHRWEAVNIGIGALWDPNNLLDCLGHGDKYQGAERSTQIGLKNILGLVFRSARPDPTVKKVLKAKNTPLLLILDEAHALGDKNVPPSDFESTAIEVLEAIHNGTLKRPVVLLAAGLNTTSNAFESLKISRFAEGCFVELAALSKESERAVIKDWLVKEGGAKADPSAWITAITRETHCWPRHIHSYSYHAAEQLKANAGLMTSDGLSAALKAGHVGRKTYYQQRLSKFDGDQIICLAEAISDIDLGMPFNKEHVWGPLNNKYGPKQAEKLFQQFLNKGVISKDGLLYSIPIPSMHDWMNSELNRAQERLQSAKTESGKNAPQ